VKLIWQKRRHHSLGNAFVTAFWEMTDHKASAMVPFETAVVVSYRLSNLHCDHCAISMH